MASASVRSATRWTHQGEHCVPGLAAIVAVGSAAEPSSGDAGPDVVLGAVCVQRDVRVVEYPEEVVAVGMQAGQQAIEGDEAGPGGEQGVTSRSDHHVPLARTDAELCRLRRDNQDVSGTCTRTARSTRMRLWGRRWTRAMEAAAFWCSSARSCRLPDTSHAPTPGPMASGPSARLHRHRCRCSHSNAISRSCRVMSSASIESATTDRKNI